MWHLGLGSDPPKRVGPGKGRHKFFTFDEHIIDINLHGFTYQQSEYFSHHPLISCPCVFKAKRHYVVVVQFVWCDEGCFFYVKRMHRNLMVPREGVPKR